MIRRRFSTLSGTIVGIFEGQPHLKCQGIDEPVLTSINYFLKNGSCKGKRGESNLFISPDGEALAVVGVGSESAPLLGERIRNAVCYILFPIILYIV